MSSDKEYAPALKSVIAECKRWDLIPNRCEPFTLEMWSDIDERSTSYDNDSLLPALRDWFAVCLYGGYRNTEWAQDDAHPHPHNPLYAPNGTLRAFTLLDVEFRDHSNRQLSLATALAVSPDSIGRVQVTHSWQKNGDHGEQRLFTANDKTPALSYPTRMQSICRRFVRLFGATQHSIPLCVYRHESGNLRLITATDISSAMRDTACRIYNLRPSVHQRDLSRWSSHSLRVGACVILYSLGFSDTQLQFLLRWKSNAFFSYLRNLAVLSNQQNQAMADLSTMPSII